MTGYGWGDATIRRFYHWACVNLLKTLRLLTVEVALGSGGGGDAHYWSLVYVYGEVSSIGCKKTNQVGNEQTSERLAINPDWTNKQIADAAGCNAKSLSRWERFKKARRAYVRRLIFPKVQT